MSRVQNKVADIDVYLLCRGDVAATLSHYFKRLWLAVT
ncbi:hypothetical protein JCM19238_1806 [Vibrio ponticus]|nr:hypothetical protein JCM19238_1806 [Vibrio ponticus]